MKLFLKHVVEIETPVTESGSLNIFCEISVITKLCLI